MRQADFREAANSPSRVWAPPSVEEERVQHVHLAVREQRVRLSGTRATRREKDDSVIDTESIFQRSFCIFSFIVLPR